jgi:hypothetical protein
MHPSYSTCLVWGSLSYTDSILINTDKTAGMQTCTALLSHYSDMLEKLQQGQTISHFPVNISMGFRLGPYQTCVRYRIWKVG